MVTAVKKKVAKKKKVVKKASDDLIINVVHEVENMDRAQAIEAAEHIDEDIGFSYFKLGGILSRIHVEQWHLEDGADKFPDYVESKFGIRRSKAFHLISIYNGLIESGVAWGDVKDVGWSKLKELVHVINPKNAAKWAKLAEDMTLLQLIEYVKKQQAKAAAAGPEEKGSESDAEVTAEAAEVAEAKKISSMTFKVHEDQKDLINQALEKAKTEAGTEYPTVALEAVCMSFLSGPSKPAKTADVSDGDAVSEEATLDGLRGYMENFTWEDVLGVFEKIWPDIDLTVETDE